MVSLAGNEEQFLIAIDGVAAPLHVVRFSAREGVSQLYSIELELSCLDLDLPLDQTIGQSAVLTVEGEEEGRFFHGIVARFEQVGNTQRYTIYRALVVPWVWRLQFRRDVRIFQETSVPDIVKEVLTGAGLAADAFRFDLEESYDPREYCVQYRESDWDFVSRLLEEEGIFYQFEHLEDDHILVFADGGSAHQPIAGTPDVQYRPASGMQAGGEVVTTWAYSRQMRTGKVTLQDFFFEQPDTDLTSDKTADVDSDLEHYDYPGRYEDGGLGRRRAQVRLEEHQTFLDTGRGASSVNRMIPGALFTLEDHPSSDANAEWLLVRVEHEGEQPIALGEDADPSATGRYGNRFTVIPGDRPFRCPRITPKPSVRGIQTAIVVGPSGEEIYVDEHGRVKVQFHWDRQGQRDEKSSCWIRVSQLWAGQGWGAMWIPRIGHEVLVDFIEGDPDRPIITGRVYHGTNTPPYDLPAEKTKSTIKSESSKGGGGFNELRFEDLKDKEEIFLHGQKDWTIQIQNDKNQTIGHDETLSVGNDRTKTVEHDETVSINNNHTVTVKADDTTTVTDGNQSVTVSKGNRTIEVTKGDQETNVKAGNHRVEAKAEATIKADTILVEGKTKIELKVGGNTITIDASGIKVNGMQIETTSTGPTIMTGAMINLN